MMKFTETLIADVETYLDIVSTSPQDIISRSKRSIQRTRESCDALTRKLTEYVFANVEEEIYFFKEVKPLLFSKLFYHKFIYKLEVAKPIGPDEIKRSYLIKHLNKIAKFYKQNREFYNYYSNKQTNFDDKYFTRCKELKSNHDFNVNDEETEIMFTSHDLYVARILACKQVESYIIKELQKFFADSFSPLNENEKLGILKELNVRWTDPIIDLIELLYGLHRKKCINHGNVEIKTLVKAAEIIFNVKIKDVYRAYSDIKSRHHKTKFLDSLRDGLDKSIDEDDDI